MAKIGTLTKNEMTGKWEAKYNGRVLAASPDKGYVIGVIAAGKCRKANDLGVTAVEEPAGSLSVVGAAVAEQLPKQDRFNINERFDFLESFVVGVAKRTYPSLVVTGEGGLGKSYSVHAGLQGKGKLINASEISRPQRVLRAGADEDSADEDDFEMVEVLGVGTDSMMSEAESRKYYTVVKGFSTAKGLYATLYENRNRVIVFDDCDSILKDPTALNILKGALDSYEKRIISWNARGFIDDGLPNSFEFKGGVIFVSNMPLYKIDQAIRSRSICVDLSMNVDQKIERMAEIIKVESFMPGFSEDSKKKALEFIEKMKNEASEISFRTLIQVTKIADEGDVGRTKWERRAEYVLTNAN
jgi:hypothetical protein